MGNVSFLLIMQVVKLWAYLTQNDPRIDVSIYKSAEVNINIHCVDKVSNINGKIRVKSWKNKFFL